MTRRKKPRLFFTGILKTSTSNKTSHYDTPKIYNNNENIILKFNGDVNKTVLHQQNNNMNTIDKVSLHSLYVDVFFFSSFLLRL